MEGSWESYHVKGEGLSPVVGLIPESDGQINLPQRHALFARHDAMERRSDRVEVRPVDAHLIERLGVHDVEAATSVHQYFRESLRANDRVDHERVSPRVRDVIRMVGLIEGYDGL